MSVTIEKLEKAQDVSDDGTYLQHIPAKIDYEGPANVKNFFTNFTSQNEKESNTPLFNAFRGRPLNGKKLAKLKGISDIKGRVKPRSYLVIKPT